MVETPDGFIVAVLGGDRSSRTRRPIRPAMRQVREAWPALDRRRPGAVLRRRVARRAPTRASTSAMRRPASSSRRLAQSHERAPSPPGYRRLPRRLRGRARHAGLAARRGRSGDPGRGVPEAGARASRTPSCWKASKAARRAGAIRSSAWQPDLIWRCRDGRAEINRHALSAPHAFVADTAAGAGQPARADRRDAAGCAGGPAADVRRAGRLSRLRHGPADGAICRRRTPM